MNFNIENENVTDQQLIILPEFVGPSEIESLSGKPVNVHDTTYSQYQIVPKSNDPDQRFSYYYLQSENPEADDKIIRVVPQDSIFQFSTFKVDQTDYFSGFIHSYSLEGEKVSEEIYRNGKELEVQLTDEDCGSCRMQHCTQYTTVNLYRRIEIAYYLEGEYLGSWYADWELVGSTSVCTNSGGGGQMNDYQPQHRGYGGGGSTNNNETNPTEHEECMNTIGDETICDCVVDSENCEELSEEELADLWEEENIDYSDLPDCLQDIANSIKDNTTYDFAEILNFYDNNPTDIDITYSMSNNLPDSIAGYYNWDGYSDNDELFIDLNNNTLGNSTDLYAAALIMHETLHAYMSTIIMNVNNESLIINEFGSMEEFRSSFKISKKLELFYDAVIGGSVNPLNKEDYPGEYQHNFMARNFVEPIYKSLKEFDNNSEPDRYYWELAWAGLAKPGIGVWDEYQENPEDNDFAQGEQFPVAMTENNMDEILETIFLEQDGEWNAKGDKLSNITDCF